LSFARDSAAAEPASEHRAGRIHWQVLPGWDRLLFGPHGLRLEEWREAGLVRVIKHGSHRTVYRVDLPERTFFLKHYRIVAPLMAVRHLLRSSSARREWRNALEVTRRRVPTITPVALGEQYRGGLVRDCFFVSEAIPDSCTLEDYAAQYLPRLPRPRHVRQRRLLTLALARLCADAHRAGVFHKDFHAGNVLVRLDTCDASAAAGGSPQLHLIDLPAMRFSGPLDWPASRDNLVMLAASWIDHSSMTERWRFWRAYLAERPDLRLADRKAAVHEIARGSAVRVRKTIRQRDKRALANNRDYYRLVRPSAVGYGVTDLAREELKRLLDCPSVPLHEAVETIKHTRSTVVVKARLSLSGEATFVAYKRARYKHWWKALLAVFRRSRSLRAWYLGHALLQRGIATARPVCVCEPRRRGLRWESYLAAEWIEGEDLQTFVQRIRGSSPAARWAKARVAAVTLGRLLGRMHAWHVAHRDLKAANLMVVDRREQIEAYLIDLDGVRLLRRISPRRRARNLARLATSIAAHPWVTRTLRLRFLRAYLEELPDNQRDWKALCTAVERHTRSTVGQMRRRGQPLH
jgi:tRNA A-37 threonylcarbamoyl transferase component Bud32